MATHYFKRDLPIGTVHLYLLRHFSGGESQVMSRYQVSYVLTLEEVDYNAAMELGSLPSESSIVKYTQADGSIVTINNKWTESDGIYSLSREVSKDFVGEAAFYSYTTDYGTSFLIRVSSTYLNYLKLRAWNPFEGAMYDPEESELFWDNPL
jgi:hypothetical protein